MLHSGRRTQGDRSLLAAMRSFVLFAGTMLLPGIAIFPGITPAAEPAVEFNRDIRPILSENCFACHGPDARKREAGLRLDRAADATAKLESGAVAIVAGNTAASELVRRITSGDDEERMPPPDSNKQLDAARKLRSSNSGSPPAPSTKGIGPSCRSSGGRLPVSRPSRIRSIALFLLIWPRTA